MKAAAEEDPALAADEVFYQRLSGDLKEVFPSEKTPPFPDFFNSHIQKQIRDLSEAAAPSRRARPAWWPDWLRLSWAVPLGAAAVVLVTLMQIGLIGGRTGSQITYAYTPDDSVTAITDFDEGANAMVVRLEGMEPLPEDFDLLLADASLPLGGRDPMVGLAASAPERAGNRPEWPVRDEATDVEAMDSFEFVGPQIQFTSHVPTY
jgi:hypothetical protein